MRYVSIDLLRTFAIVMMVLVHFLENLAGVNWAPAGAGAPIFAFLVGVSYRLWADSQEARGKTEAEISHTSIRRGLFLFALGLAFNVVVWLPEDVFNWDVLTMLGVSLLVLNIMRGLPLPVAAVFAAVTFALGPVVQKLADYPSYWSNGYFDCEMTPSDVALGFMVTGYFPLIPWLTFPLAGYVTGTLFFDDPGEAGPPTGQAAIVGALMLGVAATAVLVRRSLGLVSADAPRGWTMFPATMEYVAGTLGLALLLFSLAHRWIDPAPGWLVRAGIVKVAGVFSKYSLSMYLFHHVVHVWPMWAWAVATGTDLQKVWRSATSWTMALLLVPTCLLAGYLLFSWMERTKRPGVEGLMRKLCG